MFSHIADRISDHITESPRESLAFAVVAVFAAGLLIALYMVCSGQVSRAELRDATLKSQRIAVSNCMEYSHKATLTSCIAQVAGVPGDAGQGGFVRASVVSQVPVAAGQGAIGSMKPVSFAYR